MLLAISRRLELSGLRRTGDGVGPLEKPFRGGLGPQFSFITISFPRCLPERMEVTSYCLEFGFMHDDVIDKNIDDADLEDMQNGLEQGGKTGSIDDKGACGKRKIAAQIMREMMGNDPERAINVAKSWAAGVQDSARREKQTDFQTVDDYLAYRFFDVGYMYWHGLVIFGCAITIPAEDGKKARELIMPAASMACLVNDLFSFEKERNDTNLQNALPIVMHEHTYTEQEGRVIVKQRIRVELPNRYNLDAESNDLQKLRAEHRVIGFPTNYQLMKSVDGSAGQASVTSSHKRQKYDSLGEEISSNATQKAANAAILTDDKSFTSLTDHVILQPYKYLTSLPSKGLRDQAIDGINIWLNVPAVSVSKTKAIINKLHSASLMLDDLEDNSPLRRSKLSTHSIFSATQTINSATYQFFNATAVVAELDNPCCFRIFVQDMKDFYLGQSYDLYWTHNAICPTIPEYLKMVDMKTGGLFRMLTRLMIAESPDHKDVWHTSLEQFSRLIGRFFQIRDDYQNLVSADYAKQKGFAEDLDKGKYSFTLIHCIQTLEQPRNGLEGDRMFLQALLIKRRVEGKLSDESKREVLAIMNKTKSLQATLNMLREMFEKLQDEVTSLEARFGEENFLLKLLLELLKV